MKRILSFVLALAIVWGLAGPIPANVISARAESAQTQNGFVTEGSNTYYYINGVKATGWQTIEGSRYYFKKSTGVMLKDCFSVVGAEVCCFDATGKKVVDPNYTLYTYGAYDRKTGQKATGWIEAYGEKFYCRTTNGALVRSGSITIDGSTYSFDANGVLLKTPSIVDDKCYLGGVQVYGWQTINGTMYYFSKSTGLSLKGMAIIGAQICKFDATGKLIDEPNYTIYTYGAYSRETGKKVTGWVEAYGEKFYFRESDGNMLRNCTTVIDGVTYKFDNSGAVVKTPVIVEDKCYIAGTQVYGWQTVNGSQYYFSKSTGLSLKGMAIIGAQICKFDATGKLIDEPNYTIYTYGAYSRETGKKVTGWVEAYGEKFYFRESDGNMLRNCTTVIDGVSYKFDNSGAVAKTPVIVDDKCYVGGEQVYGWQTVNGSKYYFSKSTGLMLKDQLTIIGAQVAKFAATGELIDDPNYTIYTYGAYSRGTGKKVTGWVVAYGEKFYFRESDGYMLRSCASVIGGRSYTFNYFGILQNPPLEGSVEAITDGLVVNGSEIAFAQNATLQYQQADSSAGRTEAGWWAGFDIKAPEDLTDADDFADVVFQVKEGDSWSEPVAFWEYKTSADTDKAHYMRLWRNAELQEQTVTTWRFDWNGDGEYEQEFTLTIAPDKITYTDPNGNTMACVKVNYDYNKLHSYPYDVRDLTYADTHGFWEYAGTNAASSIAIRVHVRGFEMHSNNGSWVAFKLQVPAAGSYRLTQQYHGSTNAGMVDAYLFPGTTEDIAAALSGANAEEHKLGSFDCYDPAGHASDSPAREADFGFVNFPEAGEYYVVYKAVGKRAEAVRYYMYVGDLTLDGIDRDKVLMGATADVARSAIKSANKTQVFAGAYFNDHSSDGITYSYTSLNPSIATVNSSGVVTGVSAGEATIRVTALVNGESHTADVSVRVDVLEYSGTYLDVDYKRFNEVGDCVRNITFADTHGFWEYYADNTGLADAKTVIGKNTDLSIGSVYASKYIAFKIRIPRAGDYNITQQYRQITSGGAANVYILPGNLTSGQIAANLTSATKIGSVSFKGSAGEGTVLAKDFGAYGFAEAGEYLLVYKSTAGGLLYIDNVIFDGGESAVPMDMTASLDQTTIEVGQTAQISVNGYFSDGSTAAIREFTSQTSSADISIDDSGMVTGKSIGLGDIVVSVDNLTAALCIAVEASTPTVKYTFGQYQTNDGAVRSITDYAATHNFWKYYTDSDYSNSTASSNFKVYTAYGIQAKTVAAEKYIALKIQVPAAGDYMLSLGYATAAGGGSADVYILPGSTTASGISAKLTDANLIGALNFSGTAESPSADTVTASDIGEVNFAVAGEYIVVYKATVAGNFYINGITLQGSERAAVMDLEASVSKSAIVQGETHQINTKAYMSDGTFDGAIFQYQPSAECVAVNRRGLITAVAAGDADISITAVTSYGEMQVSVSVSVTAMAPSGSMYYYDFRTGFAYKDDVRQITYENTNDMWEYYADGNANRTLDIHTTYGIRFQNSGYDDYVAVKINVPKAGSYMFNQTYGTFKTGGLRAVYILPGDIAKDSILTTMKNSTPFAYFNNYENLSLYPGRSKADLGIVTFPEAGEYVIGYLPIKDSSSPGAYNLHIGSIRLDGVNCLKTVDPDQTTVNLNYGDTYQSEFVLRRLDGSVIDPKDCTITYVSDDTSIATVDTNGMVLAVGHGETTIEISVYDGVETHTAEYTVVCTDDTGIKSVFIDIEEELYVRETAKAPLTVEMNSGSRFALPTADVTLTVSDESLLSAAEGTVTALAEGEVTIYATGTFMGEQLSAELAITVKLHPGKTEPTYYTNSMRNVAQQNIAKYSWAKSTKTSAVNAANALLSKVDTYYDLIVPEGIPRSRQVAYTGDTSYGVCRYCGTDVQGTYGSSGGGGWNIDIVDHPWKVQCKECLNWFPSNDFGSFYKLGLDENGVFDYDKAWEENEKLIAAGQAGYLVNTLYPEKGEYWGVDDGFGAREYKDGSEYYKYTAEDENVDKAKSAVYIALYHDNFWYSVRSAINAFANAYVYSGDITYARAGAYLLDRVADVTPDYNFRNYSRNDFLVSCGGTGYGTYVGRIEDALFAADFAIAADAFFPALSDGELIEKLSAKAAQFGLENDKSSSQKIWQNWRNNLLLESLEMAKDGRIYGNYGMTQRAVAVNAVVLAEEPESANMMRWIYETNTSTDNRTQTGGNLTAQLINVIDRNGIGNEGANNYNSYWVRLLYNMAGDMAKYSGKESYNPYENPKFVQMFMNYDALTQSDYYITQIGDTGDVASADLLDSAPYVAAWKQLKNTPMARDLAQFIYITRKGNLNGLRYGIFSANPEGLAEEIMAMVDIHKEKESEMLTGYGYSTLKEGFTGDRESLRSTWMYYGINNGHGHRDTLNIGLDAFGLNLSPDTGYPANTVNDPSRKWTGSTIAHNTVLVDGANQSENSVAEEPWIFDDSAYVQVMGAEAKDVYRQTDSYNRTVVMVKVDENNSYFVDFFRVLGGQQHVYSFHAQSHNATAVSGLQLTPQVDADGNYVGTYAGADIAKGETGDFYTPYSYMTKVRKDTAVASNRFTVDFAITDYRSVLTNGENIHLKMTQINNFTPDEVAIVGGHINKKTANAVILKQTDTLEYVLTQRNAAGEEDLDSMFMTVFEPYRENGYIASIAELPVSVVSGTPEATDMAKALMITHVGGRIDYVFYATNNTVTYRVGNLFNVRSHIGVYSVDAAGNELYRYTTGGDLLVSEMGGVSEYTGKVIGHSTGLSLYENYIDVNLDAAIASGLVGRYIYVENDGKQNAVYKIEGVKAIDGGIRLDLGTISLIRQMRDSLDESAGYVYNIAKGQRFTIPMSHTISSLSNNTALTSLTPTAFALDKTFSADVADYTASVENAVSSTAIHAVTADSNATVKMRLGGTTYAAGEMIPLAVGANVIKVTVTAQDGMTVHSHYITVTRAK